MLNRSTVLVVSGGLALALIGYLGWRALDGDGGERDGAAQASRSEVARPESTSAKPSPPTLAERPGPETPEVVHETTNATERRLLENAKEADPLPEGALELAGRLLIPSGSPEDGTLQVAAITDRARWNFGLAELTGEQNEESDEVYHRTNVAPDGSFVLGLPPDADEIWIDVDGRYLYLQRPLSVPLDPPPAGLEVRAELGGWVTGRLLSPEGASNGSLESSVELRRAFRDVNWGRATELDIFRPLKAETTPTGDFEFRGVPASSDNTIVAVPAQFAPLSSEGLDVVAGERAQVDLPLLHGAHLSGVVKDEAGEPIEGAEIRVVAQASDSVMPWDEFRRVHKEAETDAAGAFEIVGAPVGSVELRAAMSDWGEDDEQELDLAEGQELDTLEFTLERKASISGVVHWDDGAPAEGAEIRVQIDRQKLNETVQRSGDRNLWREVARLARKKAVADENGAFALYGLDEGVFVVHATCNRGEEGDDLGVGVGTVNDVATGSADVALVLEAGLVIAGVVTSESGEPVTEFSVRAEPRREANWMSPLMRDGVQRDFEDANGNFQLLGVAGEGDWRLTVNAEGYLRNRADITLPDATTGPPIEIELQLATSVAGTVVDPSGNPVPGAQVAPVRAGAGFGGGGGFGGDASRTAITDAAGNFVLGRLTEGVMKIQASARDFAPSEPLELDLAQAELRAGVVLRLTLGGAIEGQIFDDEGEPAAGRMINVMEPPFRNGTTTTSDAEGRFRFANLTPGSWQIIALPADFGEDGNGGGADFMSKLKMQEVEVLEGEVTEVVMGAAPTDPVKLTGRVTAAGQPVGEAMINMVAEGGNVLGNMRMVGLEEDGTFEVELNKPGRYVISVSLEGGRGDNSIQFYEDVPELATHHVELELPTGRISGRVTGPDGRPREKVRVRVAGDGPQSVGSLMGGMNDSASTDEDGRFAFEYVAAGTYSVSVSGKGGDEDRLGKQTRGGLVVDEGKELAGVDFELETPGEIEGRVVDATGRAVPGASIFVRNSDGRVLDRMSRIVTDELGSFTYGLISPGTYTLSARATGRASQESRGVRVVSGGTTEVTLEAEVGTMLVVSCMNRDREPVTARVSVLDSDGRQVNGMLTESALAADFFSGFSTSEQRIGPLPPGTYSVLGVTDDGRERKAKVKIAGQSERKIRLRFRGE